ncbi:uncharacterized protein LOC120263931 [Dioscorea cayenensis subsp. rotundata]|uniref:Uncharacterized protein LOC120263931 n=1 Tax=Dioscorea cayennensis subsp. rotundata TaxID=55577 RepID=A0AB40BMX4_DIOCR|nr:uncharacterized protein LOC120263931 [Dioscorea cayenensis subsp. rotundata]
MFGEITSSVSSIRPKHLKAMVRKELGVFITDKVCRNARSLVIKKIEEQFKEDFKVLNNYALELKTTNPGSSVHIMTERQKLDELPLFKRIYICIAAIREGFINGCRRVIGIDGCFLKGSVKGQILTAVGRDGNNQMFPVAWAVVDKETSETWLWFIELLKVDLLIEDGLGWVVLSDMQKGLQHAVNALLPLIEHRMCARHIYARWGKIHPGKDLQIQFWNVAKSSSQPEMRKQLDRMKSLKGGVKAAEELLERWPISGWCLEFFNDIVKCDVIDNNMCETFNGVILDSRSKPIITMLEDIRQYVMTRVVVKREYCMEMEKCMWP